jgi:hypothetical protein
MHIILCITFDKFIMNNNNIEYYTKQADVVNNTIISTIAKV